MDGLEKNLSVLNDTLKHHHIHLISCCYAALVVMQNNQAIGFDHRPQDA
jgi:hypothetical protein